MPLIAYFNVTKLHKLFDMAKPPLGKVEALLYVLQHISRKRACQNFDTPSYRQRMPDGGCHGRQELKMDGIN